MEDRGLNKSATDYLYLTEVLNDLNVNGFIKGGKAEAMLLDLRAEFKLKMNFPKTKQRKIHADYVGVGNW